MSFNLFGPSDKNDIRVGYISTTRGYVGNISRYEANLEAKLNPGTQFILRRRDKIEFMNINKVNELTPDDFIPTNSGKRGNCTGVTGLDIYEDDDGSDDDDSSPFGFNFSWPNPFAPFKTDNWVRQNTLIPYGSRDVIEEDDSNV